MKLVDYEIVGTTNARVCTPVERLCIIGKHPQWCHPIRGTRLRGRSRVTLAACRENRAKLYAGSDSTQVAPRGHGVPSAFPHSPTAREAPVLSVIVQPISLVFCWSFSLASQAIPSMAGASIQDDSDRISFPDIFAVFTDRAV